MKLLRLKLGVPFRSLAAGFEVLFLREWDHDRCLEFHPYCLAGRNGSGKSNVLEALAAIFYHIECINLEYRPDGFEYHEVDNPNGFRAEVCTPDSFELEYLIEVPYLTPKTASAKPGSTPCHIRIVKEKGSKPIVSWRNPDRFENDDYVALVRNDVKSVLPKFVVGYSSGHNEILSLPFLKMRFVHFDEYCHYLTNNLSYTKPEGRLIYLDDQISQALLLCHFLFPCEPVLRVFQEKIGINGIRCFRIIIRKHHRLPIGEERLKSMIDEEKKDKTKLTVELTSNLTGHYDENNKLQAGLIDKLIRCSTAHYEEPSDDGEGGDLYLDYWVNEETRKAFQYYFGEGGESESLSNARSALNLFHAIQTLFTLNHYQVSDGIKQDLYGSNSIYVNETIPLPASDQRIMRFKDFEIIKDGVAETIYGKALSDGEHQLLHTIGLCLLFRHEPVLFLLDEPETHLNPDWRASYISTLRQAMEADIKGNVMREVLLTSHSPFIISDCRKENVLVFTKDPETREVTWGRPGFETFGASANAITIKVFGQIETIGNYAMGTLNGLRERLEAGQDPDQLIDEAGNVLGDSVEKVLFVNQALNRKEGK